MSVSMGFSAVNEALDADFMARLPGYHKSRRRGLALLSSILLDVKSANLMELSAALPRDIGSIDHRYQYVSRLLGNSHIDCGAVMRAYAGDVFTRLAARGETIVLMLDQSHINDTNEVLMLSVRLRDRALPVAWRVRKTKGNIGFPVQKALLDSVSDWLPDGANVMLAADRFYGTSRLISWCQAAGWGYRIRLKGNLTLQHQGGELSCGEIAGLLPEGIVNAELYNSGVTTNIGVLQEGCHAESWIIAMDATPGKYTTLDYGMRWGIEAMFSDFKTRGFGIAQSQIKKPDRLERLILVMAIAMYWAVSSGAMDEKLAAQSGVKRGFKNIADPYVRSLNKGCVSCADASLALQKSRNSGRSGYFEGW